MVLLSQICWITACLIVALPFWIIPFLGVGILLREVFGIFPDVDFGNIVMGSLVIRMALYIPMICLIGMAIDPLMVILPISMILCVVIERLIGFQNIRSFLNKSYELLIQTIALVVFGPILLPILLVLFLLKKGYTSYRDRDNPFRVDHIEDHLV